MGAFDTDKVYAANPYNGEQRMKSVTWIIISVVFGCVFIAKRLYFKNEKKRLGRGDPQTDFTDIMSDVILCLLWFLLIFGPPNQVLMTILFIIFLISIFMLVKLLRG